MQEEMEKMKEENRMLRRVVDRTMRDYYELQMKLAAYQQQPADEPKVIELDSDPKLIDLYILFNLGCYYYPISLRFYSMFQLASANLARPFYNSST